MGEAAEGECLVKSCVSPALLARRDRGIDHIQRMAGPDTPLTTTRFADVNGVRLHYARAGRGPLIILLHGFPEFWYTWKDVLPELARDHLAVAPDMRGYNLSSKPADVREYRMSTVAADIVAAAGSPHG